MNLDKKVVNFTAIATPFSFLEGVRTSSVNSFGYFTDRIADFSNLENCVYGKLEQVNNSETPFKKYDGKFYTFFLAEIFVEKHQEQYRPYTLEEFNCQFEFGDFITFRHKGNSCKLYAMYTGIVYDEMNDDPSSICVMIGDTRYTLKNLFDNYEICDDTEEWKPFGVSYCE